MADDYLITPPAQRTIVLTKGTDLRIALHRRDIDGITPLDWGGDVAIDVDLSRAVTQRTLATVTGPDALLVIESEVADLIKNGVKWRIILVITEETTITQRPLLVGTIERHDG